MSGFALRKRFFTASLRLALHPRTSPAQRRSCAVELLRSRLVTAPGLLGRAEGHHRARMRLVIRDLAAREILRGCEVLPRCRRTSVPAGPGRWGRMRSGEPSSASSRRRADSRFVTTKSSCAVSFSRGSPTASTTTRFIIVAPRRKSPPPRPLDLVRAEQTGTCQRTGRPRRRRRARSFPRATRRRRTLSEGFSPGTIRGNPCEHAWRRLR
jgi:hypothetical protein